MGLMGNTRTQAGSTTRTTAFSGGMQLGDTGMKIGDSPHIRVYLVIWKFLDSY